MDKCFLSALCTSAAFANDVKPVLPRNTHCHHRRSSTMHTGKHNTQPRREWGTDASTAAETAAQCCHDRRFKASGRLVTSTGIPDSGDRLVIIRQLLFSSDIYVTVHGVHYTHTHFVTPKLIAPLPARRKLRH